MRPGRRDGPRRAPAPPRTRAPIDVAPLSPESLELSAERARAVLEERARRLARPATTAGGTEERLEVVTVGVAHGVHAIESRLALAAKEILGQRGALQGQRDL